VFFVFSALFYADESHERMMSYNKKLVAQRGAQTNDPENKSLMLYRQS
jgi:hypothetical protein